MEIHLLYIVWFSALFFTLLSFYLKNYNWVFPVIAAVGWIVTAMSLGEVSIYGFDSMGNAHSYTINMGDPNTAGMVGAYWWFWGIGIVLILLSAAWIIAGKRVGEDV